MATSKITNSGIGDINTLVVDTTGIVYSGGNVGIGESSPTRNLVIKDTDGQVDIGLVTSNTGVSAVMFADTDDSNIGRIQYLHSTNDLTLTTNDSEAARIDSSQNFLVGKTSANFATAGATLYPSGMTEFTRDGDKPLKLNRLTSDGDIAIFAKDGTTVGSIGTAGDALFIGSEESNLRFNYGAGQAVIPATSAGAVRDNIIDLGESNARFDDIYATNGTIQTSDQNEKQQIAALTDAEITAAKSISGLFKTFKWNSAVETKGDAARTHTGVIAQDVQQAMTDAGLDAGDYAFFISSTWWETQTEVPAVEAVDAVLDGDGNVVTEAVEAKDAYTRTDTYETAEEAPEGATERTRLGVRYPELLAFIGAATEQRLANIESRLAALESA